MMLTPSKRLKNCIFLQSFNRLLFIVYLRDELIQTVPKVVLRFQYFRDR